MIEEMSVQESKNNKTKEEIIKIKHMLYDMRRAAPPAFIPRNGFPSADWIIQSTDAE